MWEKGGGGGRRRGCVYVWYDRFVFQRFFFPTRLFFLVLCFFFNIYIYTFGFVLLPPFSWSFIVLYHSCCAVGFANLASPGQRHEPRWWWWKSPRHPLSVHLSFVPWYLEAFAVQKKGWLHPLPRRRTMRCAYRRRTAAIAVGSYRKQVETRSTHPVTQLTRLMFYLS